MRMHDVVVVGAGGSGIPFAVRVAERGASVLLIEAGHRTNPQSASVSGVPGAQPGHPGTESYPVSLTERHPYTLQRGQALGGSTAVNGGYFIRAREHDFDRWADVGGPAWCYPAALPTLCRLETDLQFPQSPVHGSHGPMPIDRSPAHRLARALTDRALSLGIPHDPDKNDQQAPGVGPVPMNARAGTRVSTAMAYLAAPPPTLQIRTGTPVTKVRFHGTRAVGVETPTGFIPAGQVVLSAGAIGSAHLLLLSGVGPAAQLRSLGIDVAESLPVGVGLSDHPQVIVEGAPEATGPVPTAWLGAAVHLSAPDSPVPGNIELLQSLLPLTHLMAGTTGPSQSSLFVSDLTPIRRGRLSLVSADGSRPPLVNLGYLETPEDRARLRHGVRAARELLALPRAGDAWLDGWVETHLGTSVHTCGTAPMGAVTSGTGKVLGTERLSVIDTSILPTAPTRGPANTAVFLGEFLAQTFA